MFSFSKLLTYIFYIPAVITQIFNPIAEVVIPIRTPTKEAKAEMETHPVIAVVKIRKCSYNLELHKGFCSFYSVIHFN